MTDAERLLAALVLEDGSHWGEVATPIQWSDARAVLTGEERRHWISRSRGYSKTTDISAVSVVATILAPPRSRAFAFAADQGQAALLTSTMADLIARTPGLAGVFDVGASRITVKRSGTTLTALPSDAAGTWGLRPAWVVADELCWWPQTEGAKRVWEAATTALPKVPGSRLVVISTPSDPAHWSHGVLESARAEPGRWRVSETFGPPPWMDPAEVEAERRRLPEPSFRRLFLGEWAAGEDALATAGDVEAAAVLDGPQPFVAAKAPYVVAVDLGVKRDRSCLVVAHAETAATHWDRQGRHDQGRRVVVDRKLLWKPTRLRSVPLDDVEAAILRAWESYGRPTVLLDPWQALGMAQRLGERGVRVIEFAFSSASVGRLAATLYGLLRDRRLAFDRDDEELAEELRGVRLVEPRPGLYRLDHSASGHDDQAVALAMAAAHLLEHPAPALTFTRYDIATRGGSADFIFDGPPADDERTTAYRRASWNAERAEMGLPDWDTAQATLARVRSHWDYGRR